MNITQILKSFSDETAAAIEAAGGTTMLVVAKEVALDEFGAYLASEMAKAEADVKGGNTMAAVARMQALMCSAAQAGVAFVCDVDKAVIPMISDSSTAAIKALGDATRAAANLAKTAKTKPEAKDESDEGKNEGAGEGEGEGEDAEADKTDDNADVQKNEWSGADLNDDPGLRELLNDKNT